MYHIDDAPHTYLMITYAPMLKDFLECPLIIAEVSSSLLVSRMYARDGSLASVQTGIFALSSS